MFHCSHPSTMVKIRFDTRFCARGGVEASGNDEYAWLPLVLDPALSPCAVRELLPSVIRATGMAKLRHSLGAEKPGMGAEERIGLHITVPTSIIILNVNRKALRWNLPC